MAGIEMHRLIRCAVDDRSDRREDCPAVFDTWYSSFGQRARHSKIRLRTPGSSASGSQSEEDIRDSVGNGNRISASRARWESFNGFRNCSENTGQPGFFNQ